MARGEANGPGLSIHLDNGPIYPGATITGRITRHLPSDTSCAQLKICLHGHAILELNNKFNPLAIFIASLRLLREDAQTLYNGPLYIKHRFQPAQADCLYSWP